MGKFKVQIDWVEMYSQVFEVDAENDDTADQIARGMVSNGEVDRSMAHQGLEIDEDTCYFLGLMLGDGYSGAEMSENGIKYKGSAQIVNTDQEIIDTTKRVGKKFNLNFKETKNTYGTPVIVLTKTKWFREFLVRAGVDISDRKKIAKPLMQINTERTVYLLRGLFDSDGYVSTTKYIGFSNTSETLLLGSLENSLFIGLRVCSPEVRFKIS